jgi:hypothetical protein
MLGPAGGVRCPARLAHLNNHGFMRWAGLWADRWRRWAGPVTRDIACPPTLQYLPYGHFIGLTFI